MYSPQNTIRYLTSLHFNSTPTPPNQTHHIKFQPKVKALNLILLLNELPSPHSPSIFVLVYTVYKVKSTKKSENPIPDIHSHGKGVCCSDIGE
jgi:hypothetical protein